ncbi:MAG: hypothetical protein KGH72_00835 [Candidatus Micrarchaeota archaeon]|nr:hypothetical protein [Candidatus Micrarchaeota archaeon]
MNKEIYVWIVFFLVVVLAAVYIRYFYQPATSLTVTLGAPQPNNVYPYEKISVPVTVLNTGSSAIENLDIGIGINGNVTTIYKVSIPAGKQDTFSWNYTPTSAGTYRIYTVVDPSMLYNIVDRSGINANEVLNVQSQQAPMAYSMLPRSGMLAGNITQMTGVGLVASTYIYFNYSLNKVGIARVYGLKGFLYPLLNILAPYITNVDEADAAYANYSVYSVWIKGYIAPSAIYTGALGKSLNATNVSVGTETVTYMNLGNYTTLCSWYDKGWLKLLGTGGGATCLKLLNSSNATRSNSSTGFYSPLTSRILAPYDEVIENNTGFVGNRITAGILTIPGINALIYKTITTNQTGTNVCYGLLDKANGTEYCSTYVFPYYSQNRNFSLISTTAYVNNDNLTVLSIQNNSALLQEVPINIHLLHAFNITGPSVSFISGITNSCSFNSKYGVGGIVLGCTNATFTNSTLSFRVYANNTNKSVRLSSVSCTWNGNVIYHDLNNTVLPGQNDSVSSMCTSFGKPITGTAENLYLNLSLNYTWTNQSASVPGSAYIPFG